MFKSRAKHLGVAIVVCLLLGALLILTQQRAAVAHGREDARINEKNKPKWEYCAITEVGYTVAQGKTLNFAKLCFYRSTGCEEMLVKAGSESEALAQMMVKLGDDGWEMIGQSPFTSDARKLGLLYFKRRKQ